MLRDDELVDFERITKGLRLGAGEHVRRRGWYVAAGGVAVEVLAVIVDAYGRDPASSSGGGLDARSVAHWLLAAGLGVAALGAALAVLGPRLYGAVDPPGRWRRTAQIAVPLLACVLVAAGAVAVQQEVFSGTSTSVATPTAATGPVTAVPDSSNADVAAQANIPDQPLDAPTRAQLAAQLTAARSAALTYPTVADALKAHMYLAGGFAPGSGAHYMWLDGVLHGIQPNGEVDPRYPASFIYDGTSPTSRVVGLMYISLAPDPPAGFAGPNDHWHRHFNVCVVYNQGTINVPFPADTDVTKAQCDAVHGQFMRQTVWMIHTWVVPGWESPAGVFSHANPNLRCADGTYDTNAQGFCQGT